VTAGALAATVALAACSRPIIRARTSPIEPPAPEELAAEQRVRGASCSTYLGLLFPGLAQLCLGDRAKAAVIGGLAVAEVGTAVAVAQEVPETDHPGIALPLLALQDLWVYGLADAAWPTPPSRRIWPRASRSRRATR
jgi:hypothetical protein